MLQDAVRRFDPSVLAALQRFGPLLVFVHHGEDYDKYIEFVEHVPNARRVHSNAMGTLYQLPGLSRRQDPDQTRAISSIVMDGEATVTASMTDGHLETRARTSTFGDPSPGHELVITFDRPIAVSGVEVDLGDFAGDYPQTLRVDAATTPGAAPWLVWEGSARGAAMVGVLDDPRRGAVTIDLPAAPPVRQLIMTIVDGPQAFWWTVAELKVFGR